MFSFQDKLLAKIDDKDSPKTLPPCPQATSNAAIDEEVGFCFQIISMSVLFAFLQTFSVVHLHC